jgi:glutamate mutase epsilon subunit
MSNILKGYKGVIDLDLSLINKDHLQSAIKQHYKDIEDYKKYQASLPEEHRYENTIERINRQNTYFFNKREKALKDEQNRRYDLYNQIADRRVANKIANFS